MDNKFKAWAEAVLPDPNNAPGNNALVVFMGQLWEAIINREEPAEPEVISVTIAGDDTVEVGSDVTLTVTVEVENDADTSVTWESSNDEVATVSDGTVTGVAEGEVTITATSVFDDTKSDTHVVSVTEG